MEAFEHAGRAVDIASDDSQYLENFICTALETAHFRHAHELCQQWNRTFPESPTPLAPIARDLESAIAADRFSEEATREVLLTAQRLLVQAKAKMANRPVFQHVADLDSFFCQFDLIAPVSAALSLYDQLLNHIVESDHLSNDSRHEVPRVVHRDPTKCRLVPATCSQQRTNWQSEATEIDHRNAASRAYYAAFHRCMPIAKNIGLLAQPNKGSHANLIDTLTANPHSGLKRRHLMRLGYTLADCFKLRVEADYYPESDFARETAQYVIKQCEQLFAQADQYEDWSCP